MRLITTTLAIIAAMSLANAPKANAGDWATCSTIGFCGTNASLPVFGPGPLTNLGTPVANLNAGLHIVGAVGLPLLGQALWGSKGKMAVGLSWIALSLVQEIIFHAPSAPSGAYPSEVRTDLITRIVPTIIVLSL